MFLTRKKRKKTEKREGKEQQGELSHRNRYFYSNDGFRFCVIS